MKELRRTRWMVCHGVYSMLASSVAKHCSTLVNTSLLTVKNGTKQVGTMHALFAIPQLQCVLSFNTLCDVVSLQSGTSHVINATNQVKRVTGAVSYRNVCTLLSMTVNAATWLSGRVLTQWWHCVGCVEIGRVTGAVSYRNVCTLLSMTVNAATWLSRRVLTQWWHCVGCVEIGRLSRSGCGYESAAW